VISTVTLSIEFIAFEYVGKEKPSTYLLKSTVEGSPSEIVELTREWREQPLRNCWKLKSGKFLVSMSIGTIFEAFCDERDE